jgi:hypothetical protein
MASECRKANPSGPTLNFDRIFDQTDAFHTYQLPRIDPDANSIGLWLTLRSARSVCVVINLVAVGP